MSDYGLRKSGESKTLRCGDPRGWAAGPRKPRYPRDPSCLNTDGIVAQRICINAHGRLPLLTCRRDPVRCAHADIITHTSRWYRVNMQARGLRQQPGFACEECRRRKARCDRGRPKCGFCAESGAACVVVGKRQQRGPKKGQLSAMRSQIGSSILILGFCGWGLLSVPLPTGP
jgi:hypothetical protein